MTNKLAININWLVNQPKLKFTKLTTIDLAGVVL